MIIEINIGGQLRTLRFNNWQKEALGRLYGVDPMDASRKMAETWGDSLLTVACDVIYAGLVGDYRVRRQPVDFTIEQVAEWVGDAADADIAKALNTWAETEEVRQLIKLVTSEGGEEAKKKSPGQK